MKKALITGVAGQDGAYLSEFLLQKGYEVHGIKRRSSSFNTERIDHLIDELNFHLYYGDLSDSNNIISIIQKVRPDEIYNLGAMSHVKVSFEEPEYTANVSGIGTLRILEAIRVLGLTQTTKMFQASTSELYGLVQQTPQTESTPFYPRSPYGVAKLYAYWITVNYREAYNIFACNGILFNHESQLRGETFVTRKITMGVAKIALGFSHKILLGNLDAQRDWGHAKDYVESMWLMLQQDKPEDFVIASGITTSVREFATRAFKEIGVEIAFLGEGLNEKGIVEKCTGDIKLPAGQELIAVDKNYFRPAEVDVLVGDASKARTKLGWKPKIELNALIKEMVHSDLVYFKKKRLLSDVK